MTAGRYLALVSSSKYERSLPLALTCCVRSKAAAMRDPLELPPAERIVVFEVGGRAAVVREIGAFVFVLAQALGLHAERQPPLKALLDPVAIPAQPFRLVIGGHEIFQLHQLELARAEDEIARRDLVAKRLADLSDAERRLLARRLIRQLEVDEHPLSRLGPQVCLRGLVFHRADVGLEHEVERSRRSERLIAARGALIALHVIGTKALLAGLAVHHHVGEVLDVARRAPHFWVHDDRRLDADDVIAQRHDLAPPGFAHVAFELHADRPVIPHAVDAAVDLARREYKTAALCERRDLFHRRFRTE